MYSRLFYLQSEFLSSVSKTTSRNGSATPLAKDTNFDNPAFPRGLPPSFLIHIGNFLDGGVPRRRRRSLIIAVPTRRNIQLFKGPSNAVKMLRFTVLIANALANLVSKVVLDDGRAGGRVVGDGGGEGDVGLERRRGGRGGRGIGLDGE